MNVYIVFNYAERYDSTYHDIVEIFDSEEKAKACIKTCSDDYIEACDKSYPEGFDDYTVETELYSITVRNTENGDYFEMWYYQKYEVK